MKVRAFLSFLFLVLATALSMDARAHSGNSVDGMLTHIASTPRPDLGIGGTRNFYVVADDGHNVPVDLSAATLPVGGVQALMFKRVRATAAAGVASQSLAPGQKLQVRTISLLDAFSSNDVFPTSGNRKYISLLCKWPDSGNGEPRTPAFFQTQLGATAPGFNDYFQEMSYGGSNITGSNAAAAWVTMPQPRSFYYPPGQPNDGTYLTAMAQGCIDAAQASVNFSGYVGVNMMFNDLVDSCCAWGGGAFLNFPAGEGGNRVVSVTWMPFINGNDFGWLDHGVLAHELSHSFGSPHSNGPGGYQYNNSWDVVSNPGGTCAVSDASYGCLGQHAVGDNKLAMDFITGARIATHPANGAMATYNIERMAQPANAGGTHQLLKILTSDPHKYYTVESRQRVGYDQNVPGDGVIIHEVIDNRPFVSPNNPGDPARLLRPDGVTTPALDFNLGGLGARWSVGQVYLNAGSNVKITVVSYSGTGTANIKVEPATAPGEYTFTLASIDVIEGVNTVNLAVTRSAPFTTAGSLTWTTSDGTAVAGTDFGTAGNTTQKTGSLTWTAGTGGTKNITVGAAGSVIPVINNPAIEATKAFTVTISAPVGGVLGTTTAATVNILDVSSVIQLASSTASVNEAGPNVTLELTRTGSTTTAQAVTYTTTAGTATATTDYTTTTGTITFGIGETSKVIAIGTTIVAAPFIRVMNDTTIEGPETFNVTLSAPTAGASLGAPTAAVVTIESDDSGFTMASATRSFTEGAGAQTILVNRSGSAGAVSVNYTFTNGTATNGSHYTGVNGTLNWADDDATQKAIPVTIGDDAAPNAARTFTVTLSGAVGGIIAAPTATTSTIADNDNSVQFSLAATTVAEGTANLVLNVTRTGSTTGTAQVTWTANNGTAIAGTDFGVLSVPAAPTGVINWAAGDAAAKSVTIPILNDVIAEPTKAFTVSLSAPVGPSLGLGTNTTVNVTLTDNDKGLAFLPSTYTVSEGVGNVVITVQRIGPVTTAASATWATVSGTAVIGQDYGTLNSAVQKTGTLSWPIGNAANKTIVVPIINDLVGGEPDKTFTVVLTPGAGYVIAGPNAASVTIQDNDIAPQTNVQFAQPKYLVMESGVTVALTVDRVVLSSCALASTVNYATVAGTALATSDYTTKTGTLNWGAGDCTSKQITVNIVNNAVPEATEAFRVVLSAPLSGTGLGSPGDATVVILDDDELFPAGGAIPAGFSIPVGVTKGWHVSSDTGAYAGFYTLKTDDLDDGESAGLQMAGTFAAGNVNFRVKVSSELNFDLLKFYIDDVLQTPNWSGTANVAWQLSPNYAITAGAHTLKWVYTKDASAAMGMDAMYIDGLVTPAFTPAP